MKSTWRRKDLDENQIKEIVQETNFFWDIPIDVIYNFLLSREKGDFEDEVLRINDLKSKGFKKDEGVFSGMKYSKDLEVDEDYYFPFAAIDKKLLYTKNNQNKTDILYQTILDIRTYRYSGTSLEGIGEGNHFLKQVYNDYKDGFNYPLKQYKYEIIKALEYLLTKEGWRYLKQEHEIRGLSYLGGYSNEDIGNEEFETIIDQIQILIRGIEIENYCIKKLAEINTLPTIEPKPTEFKKIKWIGTPSQFGFIMERLITNGFIENPYPKSFEKSATNFLQIFEIETTKGTLAKELSPQGNSLTMDKQRLFKIPRIEEVK